MSLWCLKGMKPYALFNQARFILDRKRRGPSCRLFSSGVLCANYWDSIAKKAIDARNEQSKYQLLFWNPSAAFKRAKRLEEEREETPSGQPQQTTLPEIRLSARQAAVYSSPPLSCRMTTRDFIEDSLYNPSYGYFSKQASIFSPPEPIDFPSIRDNYAFMNLLATLYKQVEVEGHIPATNDIARQVWHTPTELFRPWYGYAIARYILNEYATSSPTVPLVIYEMGAGNGTLMINILDYIRKHAPQVYKQCKYNIIEISAQLSDIQAAKSVQGTAHADRVAVINKSIFDWDHIVPDPGFFIGMEVIDNFAHDMVRYDFETAQPYQGMVVTDEDGDYEEVYEPVSDPLIQAFLATRNAIGYQSPVLAQSWSRRLRSLLPFAPNLTPREFLPTRLYQFLGIMHRYFPRHRLILSDFDYLPDAVPGHLGPVVQTRYKGHMIPCPTYLVQPGCFDIFFPTDFDLLSRLHAKMRGESSLTARIQSQHDFLSEYADLEKTNTIHGENPMLTLYRNFKFFLS